MLRVHEGVPCRSQSETSEVTTNTDWGQVKDDLVGLAMRRGATVVGVGDPSILSQAPPGMRPADLLPQVRSMIVLGGSEPRAGEWISPRAEVMETVGTADRMTLAGSSLARHIEESLGYYAMGVPPATDKQDRAFLDFEAAAVAAGIGSESLAGPVLNPDHGFMYLGVVLTSLPLPFDSPIDTQVCPAPSCVEMWDERGTTPCLSVCPIGDGGCLGGELVDGGFANRSYDVDRCRDRVYHYWVPGYQAALERALDEPDSDKRKMILYGSFMTRTMWSITYSNVSQGQCFECMRVCPVGNPVRELL